MNIQDFSEKVNNIFKKGRKISTKAIPIMVMQYNGPVGTIWANNTCRFCPSRLPKQPSAYAGPCRSLEVTQHLHSALLLVTPLIPSPWGSSSSSFSAPLVCLFGV